MGADGAGRDKVTIKIPRPLYDKIRVAIAESGYDSVTDFIVYVLRDIVATRGAGEDELPEEALRTMKERLRNLGYL